jgi:dTDP-4-amino-4,6-dideoxygalactose transaminase
MSSRDMLAECSQLDAVLAVHMFGNLCDIGGLQVSAQGRPIIEDCAPALGSMRQGRMAGSFGAISFFSFRSGKYLSVGEGGALFSRNEEMLSRISRIADGMAVPNRTRDCAHAIVTYAKSILRSKPLYGIIGHRMGTCE